MHAPHQEEILAYWRAQDYQRSISVAAPSLQSVTLSLAFYDWERDVAPREAHMSIEPPVDLSSPTVATPPHSATLVFGDSHTGCYSPTLHEGHQPDTPTTLSGASSRPPSPSYSKWLQSSSLPLGHPSIAALWPSTRGSTGYEDERWLRTSKAFSHGGTPLFPLSRGIEESSTVELNGSIKGEDFNVKAKTAEDAFDEQLGGLESPQLAYDAPRFLGSLLDVIFEDQFCLHEAETVGHDSVLGCLDEDRPVVPNLWCLEKTRTVARPQVQASLD